MTGRTEDIRSQVHALWKQAVVQVGGVTGHVAKAVAERLGTDREDLVRRRNRLLNRLSAESGRLAGQRAVPLPGVVKQALGRVHDVLEHIAIDADSVSAYESVGEVARAPEAPVHEAAAPRSRRRRAGSGDGQGKSTPRRSRGKRRRSGNGEHPAGS
jgi:hypothetical protein